jgi:exopolysaccharide biosynthesis polyprenyl glycosylphosphotransferase
VLRKIFRMSKGRWFYGIELVIDTLIIAFSYFVGFRLQRPDLFPENIQDVMVSILMICCISIIIFLVFKTYKCGKKTYMQSMFDLIIALIIIAVASVLLDFVIKGIGIWRLTIFYAACIQVIVFAVYKYFVTKIHAVVIKPRDCIIIGKDLIEPVTIANKLVCFQSHLFNLKYVFRQNSTELLNHLDSGVQVYICSSCDTEEKTRLIEYCAVNNIDCAVKPSVGDLIINSGRAENVNDMMLLNMVVKMDIESKLAKRVIDLLVSMIGIVLTSPIMLVTCLIVYLQDRKNPIYKQTRLTRNNREFTIYKFRTMIVDAEKHSGAVLASQNDTRITRLGKILRASRIDELPQLFNVFKGDMSIVGPRPERPDIAEKIIENLPEFAYRTLVKSGVTGYAQVLGRYDTKFHEKLLFDLFYVNNYSLLLDLRIMFNTIRVLFIPSVTAGLSDKSVMDLGTSIQSKGYTVEYKKDSIIYKKTNSAK